MWLPEHQIGTVSNELRRNSYLNCILRKIHCLSLICTLLLLKLLIVAVCRTRFKYEPRETACSPRVAQRTNLLGVQEVIGGHKISSSPPTHDMMIITFFTFIILLSLKFTTFLWDFFSENTYKYNYYSRSVLLYTVSLFKPLRGFNEHRRPTKHVGYFAHRGRLLFYRKKKQLVWITL